MTGYFPDGRSTGVKDFDEEMEWRFVPENGVNHIYPTDLYDSVVRAKNELLKKEIASDKLVFEFTDVEQIVVCAQSEKDTLAMEFPALINKIATWNDLGISCEKATPEAEIR